MIDEVLKWVKRAREHYGDKIALIDDDDSSITYRELINQSIEWAKALIANGIKRGDHIALWMPNCTEWVKLEVACGLTGAVLVALNPRYSTYELEYIIKHTKCKWFIYSDKVGVKKDILNQLFPELFTHNKASNFSMFPSLERIVVFGSDTPQGAWKAAEIFSLHSTQIKGKIPFAGSPESPLNILFTSGTTSKPKGAVLSQRTVLAHSYNTAAKMKISERDVCLAALPFCGIFGLNSLWQALITGSKVVIVNKFDIEKVVRKIEKYKCSVWNAADQMYMKLIEYRKQNKVNLKSLRIGAAGMFIYDGNEIAKSLEKDTNFRILHTYGMTEVGSMLLLRDTNEEQSTRIRSGGLSTTGTVKIVDPDTFEEKGINELGIIACKGINVMDGYYNRPEENQAAFLEDGFFLTGDLGKKLSDGTIEYIGRSKEVFRISGYLVSPQEIEEFLEKITGIQTAKVVGVKQNDKTIVVAFLKLVQESKVSIEEIKLECNRLAYFKRPKRFIIVDDFPKSYGANGEKIRTDVLVKMAKRELNQ